MPLTVKEIESAQPQSKPWKLADERGLYLLISPNGSKRWHLRYSFQGEKKKISFGPFPDVSLKSARAKRDEARALIADGVDPLRERREQKLEAKLASEHTFAAVAREYIAKRANDGDKAISDATRHKTEWLLSLIEARLGRVPVREITAPLLLVALNEVQGSGRRETARRLRSFVGRVLNYAIATGRAENNPAPALRGALATPSVRHHPAVIDPEALGELLRAIDGYRGFASTNAALKLSAHLFQRPGEIRTMKWADLDFVNSIWTIPAIGTKMRREHRVPLSRQASTIIRSMEDVTAYSEYVFPSFNPKRPLSENAVTGALKRLGYAGVMTAHGFRTTACSLLNESGEFHPDAIERALAHQDSNAVRAAYNRTQYWDERVRMMQWWSDKIDSLKQLNTA
ncbi:tyrosine-type recombinase/integrase [Altererythrobacter sp. BO-6]|uniref:tyrosine-type recombinase/integrase n=1 Tax=Altererythrobacter sp. BO-6 TaxID=2604537 RepID=UPI0013E15856|nr:integrase arm-type DNA-binding domain-containing protein [Altererythrobacter sp. BO-6]QIG54489.1 tyrosine-type recombinase/integrase [Altererythrobacter sp. BO-6]